MIDLDVQDNQRFYKEEENIKCSGQFRISTTVFGLCFLPSLSNLFLCSSSQEYR
jgi:hypothetical protein